MTSTTVNCLFKYICAQANGMMSLKAKLTFSLQSAVVDMHCNYRLKKFDKAVDIVNGSVIVTVNLPVLHLTNGIITACI